MKHVCCGLTGALLDQQRMDGANHGILQEILSGGVKQLNLWGGINEIWNRGHSELTNPCDRLLDARTTTLKTESSQFCSEEDCFRNQTKKRCKTIKGST